MATIPLHDRSGRVVANALVDDEDLPAVSQYPWCLHNRGYVRRGRHHGVELMHRFLLGTPPAVGMELDHINRCKTDNRRGNLRWVTRSENRRNTDVRPDAASGHKHINLRKYPSGKIVYRVWACSKPGGTTFLKTLPTLAEAMAFRDGLGKAG